MVFIFVLAALHGSSCTMGTWIVWKCCFLFCLCKFRMMLEGWWSFETVYYKEEHSENFSMFLKSVKNWRLIAIYRNDNRGLYLDNWSAFFDDCCHLFIEILYYVMHIYLFFLITLVINFYYWFSVTNSYLSNKTHVNLRYLKWHYQLLSIQKINK
jgi:hypothetical protein